MSRAFALPEETHAERQIRLRKKRQAGRMPFEKGPALKGEVLTDRQIRNRNRKTSVAESNLIQLNPRPAQAIFEENVERRVKYAAMRTHQEMAATALAAGFPPKEAAAKAGIRITQLRKYMESADFRERISELRLLLFSGVQGRIISELDRRYTAESLQQTELMDMLRILDRSTGGKDKGIADITVNNYEAIFAALSAQVGTPETEDQSVDFPEYEAQDLLIPGGDTPSD